MDHDSETTSEGLLSRLEPEAGGANSAVQLVKAYFVGESSGDQSNALLQQGKDASAFSSSKALIPPYDPNLLALLFENSSTLRQCVDAYVVNVDSFGHHFEPLLDLRAAAADELIRDALRAEREHGRKTGAAAKDSDLLLQAAEPSDEDVATRKKELLIEMRAERARLENFFENCTTDIPFAGPEGLRGLVRQDIEVLGQGYWEVLRNQLGEVRRFNRLEARTMRLLPVDKEPTSVQIPRRISLLTQEEETVNKRFRGLVQLQDYTNALVYFKEFDDPRVIDSKTGKVFTSLLEGQKATVASGGTAEDFRPATEVLTFKITSTRGVYGVPRWMGVLLSVMGNRQAEEVNFLYFENRSVPPMAVIVSGGHLNSDTVGKLETYITNNIKGKRNSHKIMILEGEPFKNSDGGANSGRMKIVLQPLTDAQQKDGLFQGYDTRNAEKIGQAFRLPRMLRGDVQDQNRSTAEASIDFAEVQVFSPIRENFDWVINRTLLPELGVRLHKFVSNGPVIKDPTGLSSMIKDLVTANVLTPGEARELAAGVFHREFERIDADWTRQPIGLTVAGRNAATGEAGAGSPGVGGGVMSQPGSAGTQAALGVDQSKATRVRAIEKIHAEMIKAEREEFNEEVERIQVPTDLFLSWFAPKTDSKE